jgi:hypothetical protein
MYGQVHENLVLYKARPKLGHLYRQIVVVELETIQVRIFEGEVIHEEPNFAVNSPYAELYIHPNLQSAVDDARTEFDRSVELGWTPH